MLLVIQEQYHSIYIVWLSWPGSLPADGEHVKAGGAAAAELDLADKENKNLRNN